MTEEKKINTFAEMEGKNSSMRTTNESIPTSNAKSGEISIDDFSDTAVGDRVKYNRPNLDGEEDVVEKFQVFMPDTSKEPKDSQNKSSRYWPVQITMFYESKNDEDIQNREYISGARAFVNKDGSASDISFWYENCETQCGYLWELVASHLKLEPKDLSPRQFVAFLNSKPNVRLFAQKWKNWKPEGLKPGDSKFIEKNMPKEFF